MEVYGSSLKPQLSVGKSPFLTYFDYGENKEGYWDYNHMVLQFEDVVDCLKVMHPLYHFVFLFDHSSGHAKQRPDGLNASRMNKSFGGKCPAMHPTVIEREAGFLGPYTCTLEPGQTQRLMFTETDVGPFWMTPNDRILNRLDKDLDGDPLLAGILAGAVTGPHERDQCQPDGADGGSPRLMTAVPRSASNCPDGGWCSTAARSADGELRPSR
jgi:hypothetical protein